MPCLLWSCGPGSAYLTRVGPDFPLETSHMPREGRMDFCSCSLGDGEAAFLPPTLGGSHQSHSPACLAETPSNSPCALSVDLSVLDVSHKWNCMSRGLLSGFLQQVFEAHSGCSIYQGFIPFYGRAIFHCTDKLHLSTQVTQRSPPLSGQPDILRSRFPIIG